MGGKSSEEKPDPIIIGFDYYIAVHLIFGLAGIFACRALRLGDKSTVWTGNAEGRVDISVNKLEIYGGKKGGGQGGFQGVFSCYPGTKTQVRPSMLPLNGASSTYCPAYRDRYSIVLHNGSGGGAYVGMSGQIDAIGALLQGATNDYFENEESSWLADWHWINHTDNTYPSVNAVHIIRDLIISEDIGLNGNIADIDETSFVEAAEKCFDEKLGLSCVFEGSESAEEYILAVCRHINALVFQDQVDGLYKIKLLRDDYDPLEAIGGITFPILFNEDNCSVKSFSRIGTGEQVNRVVVKYYDVTTNDYDTVPVYSPALISEVGGSPVTREVTYDGVSSRILATKIGYRDLRELSQPLARVQLDASRVASYLRPGSIFKWSNEELGVEAMVLRVMKISYGTLLNGTITIDAVEDVFGYGETVYNGDNGNSNEFEVGDPELLEERFLFETPYYLYIKKTGVFPTALGTDGGTVSIVARKQTDTDRSFYIYDTVAETYQQKLGAFCPNGNFAADVARTDDTIIVTLTDGSFAKAGHGLVAVSIADPTYHEIMEIITIAPTGGVAPSDQYTTTVKRGCADTIPLELTTFDVVYVYESGYGLFSNDLSYGETCSIALLPTNEIGTVQPADLTAPFIDSFTMNARAFRPYNVANIKINGEYWPTTLPGTPADIAITWNHRNAETQMGDLYDWSENIASIPANTEYEVNFRDPVGGSTWRSVITTSAGVTWTAAEQLADVGSRPTSVNVQIFARNTVTARTSQFTYVHTFSQ